MTWSVFEQKEMILGHAVVTTEAAGRIERGLARLFGQRWELCHNGYRHRLARWRGRIYHLSIEEMR